jgi:predicted ATPase
MITDIRLINYKSFDDFSLKISPMTLLSGLNNSGKSSIFQAIRMVWEWIAKGDPSLPSHGSLKEMKHSRASKTAPMEIQCKFTKYPELNMSVNFDYDQPTINTLNQNEMRVPILTYLSADRWGPRVTLPIYTGRGDLTHVGEHGEYVIDFLSRHERDIVPQILRHKNAEGDTLEYNVRAWLQEIAPNAEFRYGIDPKRDASYSSIDGFRPPNAGFGLSYTLPIIVALLGMPAVCEDKAMQKLRHKQGILILLENPEAHLHPKGQTSVGRMIALAVKSGIQVIVETHSDHLMDGMRIAIKEGVLSPDKTIFHYFALDRNGVTNVKSPQIDSKGKLDYWPEGFLDQTMKNRAILARR